MRAWQVVTKSQVTGILDNTRNRLLTFILELAERYPDEAREGFDRPAGKIPSDQIRQVFNYYIMGTRNIVSSPGGNMTLFDQRNQKVNYQYNAAGDINFETVQNQVELVEELAKLKAELSNAATAGVIEAEIVTDAEYQITKAIQQSQKPVPDKKVILDHLNGAKTVIEGIASAAGMVVALAKAAELVQQFF